MPPAAAAEKGAPSAWIEERTVSQTIWRYTQFDSTAMYAVNRRVPRLMKYR